MRRRLPAFDLTEYRELLLGLRDVGYASHAVRDMPTCPRQPVIYLRHDVDFHLRRLNEVSAVDAECGFRSTFFVLVTGFYNVLSPDSRAILREIVDMGHEVGLHYDLSTYPVDKGRWVDHLAHEAAILGSASGAEVESACMHEPSLCADDPLRDAMDLVNPHASAFSEALFYVSDSCRVWRDAKLLGFFSDSRPERAMLNTHGELWLDAGVDDRMEYLDRVVCANAGAPLKAYIDSHVRAVWARHPAKLSSETCEVE